MAYYNPKTQLGSLYIIPYIKTKTQKTKTEGFNIYHISLSLLTSPASLPSPDQRAKHLQGFTLIPRQRFFGILGALQEVGFGLPGGSWVGVKGLSTSIWCWFETKSSFFVVVQEEKLL